MSGHDTPGVVARWATHHTTSDPTVCGECGEVVEAGAIRCPQCRQIAGPSTGMLAVIVETTSGRRLVLAERTPGGGWVPTRQMPATDKVVRAIARQATTGEGAA